MYTSATMLTYRPTTSSAGSALENSFECALNLNKMENAYKIQRLTAPFQKFIEYSYFLLQVPKHFPSLESPLPKARHTTPTPRTKLWMAVIQQVCTPARNVHTQVSNIVFLL